MDYLGLRSDHKDTNDELEEKKEVIKKMETELAEVKEKLDIKEGEIMQLLSDLG